MSCNWTNSPAVICIKNTVDAKVNLSGLGLAAIFGAVLNLFLRPRGITSSED